MTTLQKIMITVVALLALHTAAVGVRRAVLETQLRLLGTDLPFTLESALQYRRVKMVYDTGRMPDVDQSIQYPEGVNVRATYNYGPEVVQAALAHAMPPAIPVPDRIRWIETAWFCLGIPLLALWLLWWQRSWWAALVGAGYYAVGLASVIRSTGQELSRENFALPILVGHLAFHALAQRVGSRVKFWCAAAVSAALLGLSLASWDLIQFYVMLWLAAACVSFFRGHMPPGSREHGLWLMEALALLVLGFAMPYYSAHGWLLSPSMCLVYGLALCGLLSAIRHPALQRWTAGRRCWWVLLAPLAVLQLAAWGNAYQSSYGHFGELLWAKIRYLNHKPADPAVLTFYQRIMWVPALHSATMRLTYDLFPVGLWLSFIAVPWAYLRARSPGIGRLVFFFGVSLVTFVFFARFHVFLSLFSCALLGVWAGWAGARATWARVLTMGVLVAGLGAEAAHTLQDRQRWGRTNVYYREMDELARWLRENLAPEPVLANFGVGAYVAAYAKCPIYLHPKFESEAVRQRVQAYGEALFKGTEKDFRDWADSLGARYYVYALGEFAPWGVEQQMRYFVNAVNPRPDAAARVLENRPLDARYFSYLWGNRKYEVFKILSRADEAAAWQRANRAALAFEQGDLEVAEREAVAALRLDGRQEKATDVLMHIARLRDKGFSYERDAK